MDKTTKLMLIQWQRITIATLLISVVTLGYACSREHQRVKIANDRIAELLRATAKRDAETAAQWTPQQIAARRLEQELKMQEVTNLAVLKNAMVHQKYERERKWGRNPLANVQDYRKARAQDEKIIRDLRARLEASEGALSKPAGVAEYARAEPLPKE